MGTSLRRFADAMQSRKFYALRGSGAEIEPNRSASARTRRAVAFPYRLSRILFAHVPHVSQQARRLELSAQDEVCVKSAQHFRQRRPMAVSLSCKELNDGAQIRTSARRSTAAGPLQRRLNHQELPDVVGGEHANQLAIMDYWQGAAFAIVQNGKGALQHVV